MKIDFSNFEKLFTEYTTSFLQGDQQEKCIIQLKIDHSQRVFENAWAIVSNESFATEIKEPALLAALFHDTGRFSQFAEFKTFNDRLSVNHAIRGVRVLKEQAFLATLPEKVQKIILVAVALHNRRDLPLKLPDYLVTICNIVRDSDKLDIFQVMLDHLEGQQEVDPTIVLDVQPHKEKYTRTIFEKVMQQKSCAYTEMRWTNDFRLLLASWIPLLNFSASYTLLEQSGNFDRLFEQFPNTEEFRALQKKLAPCFLPDMPTG